MVVISLNRAAIYGISFDTFVLTLQESADKLAHEVSLVVYSHAGGVGDKPGPP